MSSYYPQKWSDAANALADVLEAENRALSATDFTGAAILLPAKRVALEQIELSYVSGPEHDNRQAAKRLDRLAVENRAMLERGMRIQAQVMSIIAEAVRATAISGYGPKGGLPRLKNFHTVSAKA